MTEGALLGARSRANLEMILTWILSSSIRRKLVSEEKPPLRNHSDTTKEIKIEQMNALSAGPSGYEVCDSKKARHWGKRKLVF